MSGSVAARVLVENGLLASSAPQSMKDLILSKSHHGAYSGMRTFERTRIFLLDAHLQRLGTRSFAADAWPPDDAVALPD